MPCCALPVCYKQFVILAPGILPISRALKKLRISAVRKEKAAKYVPFSGRCRRINPGPIVGAIASIRQVFSGSGNLVKTCCAPVILACALLIRLQRSGRVIAIAGRCEERDRPKAAREFFSTELV